jgi:hypothetical protein
MKWAQNMGCDFRLAGSLCSYAASIQRLDVIQYARSQQPPHPWYEETSHFAAYNGDLNMLKWIHSQEPMCPDSHAPMQLQMGI